LPKRTSFSPTIVSVFKILSKISRMLYFKLVLVSQPNRRDDDLDVVGLTSADELVVVRHELVAFGQYGIAHVDRYVHWRALCFALVHLMIIVLDGQFET